MMNFAVFSYIDDLTDQYGIYKVETVGEVYIWRALESPDWNAFGGLYGVVGLTIMALTTAVMETGSFISMEPGMQSVIVASCSSRRSGSARLW